MIAADSTTDTAITANTAGAIIWFAYNDGTTLREERQAPSMRQAVRDARHYVINELFGDGKVVFAQNGQICRIDERSIFTRFRWQSHDPRKS